VSVDISSVWISPIVLVLARVGGLTIFAPVLGSEVVSPLIRVLLSVTLAVVLFPLVRSDLPALPGGVAEMVLALGGEFFIGMLLGLVGKLLLGSLQIAGQIMGFQMGFSMINVIDPQTQVETPVMATFQNILGVLVFLALNGHHWFIQAFVESYRIVGLEPGLSGALIRALLESAGQMFVLGLKLAAPVAVVLLIVDILLGIVGRMAPQIHVLVVGLPAKSLMGLIFLAATVHTSVPFLARHFEALQGDLLRYLFLLAR
jgi:flagellar biosynthetic protein FliR